MDKIKQLIKELNQQAGKNMFIPVPVIPAEKNQNPSKLDQVKKAFSKITDFFYEEEPTKKHLEEDENGNMIEIEDEPKRSIN